VSQWHLALNSILLYVCPTFSLFICQLLGSWAVSISSLLWTVLQWTWSTDVSLMYNSISFGYIPPTGIAGSYGSSIFVYWRTSVMFSKIAVLTYIPTNTVPSSFFSTSSSALVIFCLFDCGYAYWIEVISHHNEVLIAFYWWLMILSIFCIFCPFVFILMKLVYSDHLPIFKNGIT
jgi:hypothetical protein